MTDTKYLYAGEHPDVLASGQPVAPAEPVSAAAVDAKDPHDKRLIDEGLLIQPRKETNQ